VRWDDLVDVRWAASLGWFKLVARDGACLRMSRLSSGYDVILLALRERVPKQVAQRALDQHQRTLRIGF